MRRSLSQTNFKNSKVSLDA